MEVTNVTVKLAPPGEERLKAFCTMTLDGEFVVRDLKVIDGTNGLFVAMPSRKLTDHCPKCGGKNHVRARFCNDCGARLPEKRISDEDAQSKLHADVAHPINSECRGRIQDAVLDAYREELARSGAAEQARPEPKPEPAPEQEEPQAEAEPQPPAEESGESPPAPEPERPAEEEPPTEEGGAQGGAFGKGIL
jgi:stage V sporulation protein G